MSDPANTPGGGFLAELRRRKVFRVGAAYAGVGFVLVQVANNFFPALQLPDWTMTLVAVLVVLGFPVALELAFANLSADEENEYFSDGITEDIRGRLSRTDELRVISRTSAMMPAPMRRSGPTDTTGT